MWSSRCLVCSLLSNVLNLSKFCGELRPFVSVCITTDYGGNISLQLSLLRVTFFCSEDRGREASDIFVSLFYRRISSELVSLAGLSTTRNVFDLLSLNSPPFLDSLKPFSSFYFATSSSFVVNFLDNEVKKVLKN